MGLKELSGGFVYWFSYLKFFSFLGVFLHFCWGLVVVKSCYMWYNLYVGLSWLASPEGLFVMVSFLFLTVIVWEVVWLGLCLFFLFL